MANILPAGTPAPDFTLHATLDQTLALKGLRGRPVILAFYPADWSPVCGDQMALNNEVLSTTAMFCSSSGGRHDESCDRFGMQREIRIFMPLPFYWRRYFCSGTRCETCRADHTLCMFRETRAAVGIWHEYPQERS